MTAKLYHSSPEARPRVVRLDAVPMRWTKLDSSIGGTGFLSSWLDPDAEETGGEQPRVNWGAVCGLAIAFVVSAGFWAGVGFLISQAV